jgi:hypothetical protein
MDYRIDEGKIWLKIPYAMLTRAQKIPGGTWDKDRKAWKYHFTPNTAYELMLHFQRHFGQTLSDQLSAMRDGILTAETIRKEERLPAPPTFKTEPWPHQNTTYWMARSILGMDTHKVGGGFCAALDMGAGKSKFLVDLWQNHDLGPLLITCPNAVGKVWTKQFDLHCAHDVQPLILCNKGGVEKKTRLAWDHWQRCKLGKRPYVIAINYESVWREPFATMLTEIPWMMWGNDEVHRIKAAGSKVSRFFSHMARYAPIRIGLSGTPAPHAPLDVYGSWRWMDAGILGTNFSKVKAEYAITSKKDENIIVAYKNLDQLQERIYRIAHRVLTRDVMPWLPPWIDEVRYGTLGPEERKAYKSMDDEFYTEVRDGTITAANALVKFLRLEQLAGGWIAGERVGSSKKALLADTLDDFDKKEPLVIFSRFSDELRDIEEVVKHSGRTYLELSGDRKEDEQWAAGEADVLGVQIQTGKEGVDYTRSHYFIYYSKGFSRGDFDQSRRRGDRPGQEHNGTYIHLVMEDTIDEKREKSLAAHGDLISSLIDDYRRAA